MIRTARRAAVAALTALAAVAAIIATDFAPPASAQSEEGTGRIVARLLDDGRVEFGWQPAGGERVLPTQRYFPADITHDRWLRSSPVEVDNEAIGRIEARQLDDGRIEFAFTPTDGERILTDARYFPTSARPNRWLRSTEIMLTSRFIAVSAGETYSCALRETGEIECWRSNIAGRSAPAGVFTALSVGAGPTCALDENGELECWGLCLAEATGRYDCPGLNTPTLPDTPPRWQFEVPHQGSYIAVNGATSGRYFCAIAETFEAFGNTAPDGGEIECWGNLDGQELSPPPGRFTALSVGFALVCGLRETGAIECSGHQAGGRDAPTGSFTAVSTGYTFACGLHDTGAIQCWGHNTHGETNVPTGSFTAVSAGGYHACGLHSTGAIECWGNNDEGQTDVPAGRFSTVSAGLYHTCGVRVSGQIACWGWNRYGQTDAPTD